MSLLFFFKPITHQGFSPGIESGGPKKKRKVAKRVIKRVADTLNLELPEVREYIESALEKEGKIITLQEQMLNAEDERRDLLAKVDQMMRKAIAAKRKRLKMLIAAAMEWL